MGKTGNEHGGLERMSEAKKVSIEKAVEVLAKIKALAELKKKMKKEA